MKRTQMDDTRYGTRVGNMTRADILAFIKDHQRATGHAPTHGEIARACYLSRSGVRAELARFAEQGRLTIERGVVRGIRLTEAA